LYGFIILYFNFFNHAFVEIKKGSAIYKKS
jgi:hypothetical protein